MSSRYRCFLCDEIVEPGQEHRHPRPGAAEAQPLSPLGFVVASAAICMLCAAAGLIALPFVLWNRAR